MDLRQMSLSNLTNSGKLPPDLAQAKMDTEFEMYYKNWKDLDNTRAETAKDANRSRQSRFENKLEQRASQTHRPQKWKEVYEKALGNMWLPDLKIFADCFKQTNGKLLELPNKHKGIT